MPPDTNVDETPNVAPLIDAAFLLGNTDLGLDRIRTRLLDLTNRNHHHLRPEFTRGGTSARVGAVTTTFHF
jgi:hypothetical protein